MFLTGKILSVQGYASLKCYLNPEISGPQVVRRPSCNDGFHPKKYQVVFFHLHQWSGKHSRVKILLIYKSMCVQGVYKYKYK